MGSQNGAIFDLIDRPDRIQEMFSGFSTNYLTYLLQYARRCWLPQRLTLPSTTERYL